ncbi:hypothetical protein ABK040_005840 [Willaertia magna]
MLSDNQPSTEDEKQQDVKESNNKVIKEGELLEERIDLSKKSFYVLGKQPDQVDIPCINNSISRQHCVIQHAKNGRVYLYDLNSTNGTFWNNKKHQLKPNRYVPLWLGNQILLGMSTRVYVLSVKEGYEEKVKKLEEEIKGRKISLDKEKPVEKKRVKKDNKLFGDLDSDEDEDDNTEDNNNGGYIYDFEEDQRNKRLRIEDQFTSEMFEFDDKEFYNSKQTSSSSKLEDLDESELQSRKEQIENQIRNLKRELKQENELIKENKKQIEEEDEEDDELDKFMNTINTNLISETTQTKQNIQQEIEKLEEELKKVNELLQKSKGSNQKKQQQEKKFSEGDAEVIRDRLTRDMFVSTNTTTTSSSAGSNINNNTSSKGVSSSKQQPPPLFSNFVPAKNKNK